MRRRRGALVVAAALTVTAPTACGVTHDRSARPIDAIPFGLTDTTTTSTTEAPPPTTTGPSTTAPAPATTTTTVPSELVALYFVVGDRIRPTWRTVAIPAGLNRLDPLTVVHELETAPPDQQTLVTRDLLNGVVVQQGRAIVALREPFFALPPPPQLAIAAQLVLTLTERPGIGRVLFLDLAGQPVAVPVAGGAAGADVAAEDYRALVVP